MGHHSFTASEETELSTDDEKGDGKDIEENNDTLGDGNAMSDWICLYRERTVSFIVTEVVDNLKGDLKERKEAHEKQDVERVLLDDWQERDATREGIDKQCQQKATAGGHVLEEIELFQTSASKEG
jgi:hypothetical protein